MSLAGVSVLPDFSKRLRQRQHDADGYATTVHRFQKAGHYIVSVEGVGFDGMKAIGRLAVRVGE